MRELDPSIYLITHIAFCKNEEHLLEVIQICVQEGVTCVLSEPQFDPGIVAAVMDGTAARTAVLDPLGSSLAPGPALYPQMLRGLANALVGCLSEG